MQLAVLETAGMIIQDEIGKITWKNSVFHDCSGPTHVGLGGFCVTGKSWSPGRCPPLGWCSSPNENDCPIFSNAVNFWQAMCYAAF